MCAPASNIPNSAGVEPAAPFTALQICVLQALASGCTPTQAASRAGAHRSQLYRWINRPDFALALENAQREHYTAVGMRFHAMSVGALDALEQMLDDPECSPEARIKIAGMIFARLGRSQPPMPATVAEWEAIDRQCHDPYAPHIVVGRSAGGVTEPDAPPQPERQIQTQSNPPAPEGVTDNDACQPPVRQIQTETQAAASSKSARVTDPDAKSKPSAPIRNLGVTDPDAKVRPSLIFKSWTGGGMLPKGKERKVVGPTELESVTSTVSR